MRQLKPLCNTSIEQMPCLSQVKFVPHWVDLIQASITARFWKSILSPQLPYGGENPNDEITNDSKRLSKCRKETQNKFVEPAAFTQAMR